MSNKGVTKVSLIIFVLFLVGFFVFNFVLPVLAIHTASVSVSTTGNDIYTKGGATETFSFTVTNNGLDSIYYIKITAPSGFTGLGSLTCPASWGTVTTDTYIECIGDPDPTAGKMIAIGNSGSVSFSATAPTPESDTTYSWTVLTKDTGFNTTSNTVYTLVDVTTPSVNVIGAPTDWTTSDATAEVSCDDGTGSGCNSATYKLKIYSSDPASCPTDYGTYDETSPQTISSHSWVCGAAKDNVGNPGFSSPIEFKVDKIPPTGQLTGVPPNWQNVNAFIGLTCSDEGGSGCNPNAYYLTIVPYGQACNPTDPYTISIEVSQHSIACWKVTDFASNVNTGSSEIKVDKIKPTSEITSPAASSWQKANFDVSLTDSDTGDSGLSKCYYRVLSNDVETKSWTEKTCSSPITLTIGSEQDCRNEGTDTCRIEAYATDVANNIGDTVSRTFSIDWTPPTITDDYVNDSIWVNTDQTVTLTPSDATSGIKEVKYCEGAGCTPNIPLSSPYRLSYTIDQDTIVRYQAWDNADNPSTIGEYNVKLDKTNPTATIVINDGATYTNSLQVTLTLTYEDALSGVKECRYGNVALLTTTWETCVATKSWTLSEGDGTKTVYYEVKDNAGNVQQTSDTIFLDTVKPTTSDDYVAKDDIWQNEDQTITLIPTDPSPSSGIEWTKYCTDTINTCDPAIGTAYIEPVTISTEGVTYFRYASKDNAGNVQDTVSREVKIDKTAPTYTWVLPAVDSIYKDGGSITIGATIIEELSGITDGADCNAKIDGETTSFTGTVTYSSATGKCSGTLILKKPSNLADDAHQITLEIADNVGNSQVSAARQIQIDNTPPQTTKTVGEPKYGDYVTTGTEITLTANDGTGSGVKKVCYKINSGSEICSVEGVDTITFTFTEESEHTLEYWAVDELENEETHHMQIHYVDDTPPIPDKKVGEPKAKWDGKDANFYDIADKCWNESSEDYIECWKTTLLTPIKLDCIDPEPHPVDHEGVCFRVEWDGDDLTKEYCVEYKGDFNETGDGFCCVGEEIEFMFGKTSEHELEYYCVDALGNSNKEDLDIEKFKVEETKFEIQINKKWNLISTPVVLLNDSVKEIFGEVSDTIESVWTYDGETGQWYVYTPDGIDNDDLDTMIPGWGYWVKAIKDDKLIIGGSLMSPGKTPPSKPVVAGWNLIGYYGADGRAAYCELYSLGEDIWDKEFTSLWTYWEPDNPNQWKQLSEWDNMDPGAGYWLAVPQDGLYTPSTTCGWWN
jgi:hypothetical protein